MPDIELEALRNHPDQFRTVIRDWLSEYCPPWARGAGPVEAGGKKQPPEGDARLWLDVCAEQGFTVPMWPKEYGGAGLSTRQYQILLEEMRHISARSPLAGMGIGLIGPTLLEFGTDEQKRRHLPAIARGEVRWCQGYSEPNAGSDLAGLQTRAIPDGDRYIINGQKVWISRVQHSDLMILLARTTPLEDVSKKSDGLSIFLVDIKSAMDSGMAVRPIQNMVNHETNELFFENLEIPSENLIGEEGKGFKYILTGLNAERILIAAECIGDGYWFTDKVTSYVNEREVFGRPIGQNQGVQFPIAEAYIEIEAANLMRYQSSYLYDADLPCAAEANMAKYLAAKASWEAANACIQFHGGFGFAHEYDIERKFRETRLYQVAPISTNLILSYIAEHVLGMPRSF